MNGLVEPHSRSPSRLEPLLASDCVSSTSKTSQRLCTHLQGSEVDTVGYYETLIGNEYQGLRIKTGWNPRRMGPVSVKVGSGNPHRNYSNVIFGDRFYFNGAHMFQTQYAEASLSGLDRDSGGRLSPQQKDMTTTRLGGCTRSVRSPRSPKELGTGYGFCE